MDSRADLSAVDHLVLARLLVAGDKGATADVLRKDLGPMLAYRWSGAELEDRLDRSLADLETAGLVDRIEPAPSKGKSKRAAKPKPPLYRATPEGRRLALRFLRLDELPPKPTWAKTKKPYLLARILDAPATAIKEADLKAALLRSQFGLTLKSTATAAQSAEALAWKLIGHDSDKKFNAQTVAWTLLGFEAHADKKFDAKTVLAAILDRETQASKLSDPKTVVDRMLARKVGARNSRAAELFDAALRQWIDRAEGVKEPSRPEPQAADAISAPIARGPAGMPESPGPGAQVEPRPSTVAEAEAAPHLDLPAFADRVKAAARATSTGRFGDNKVFISHVWRTLRGDPDLDDMNVEGFKQRLTEANNARLLNLRRADQVEAMNPADVMESEVRYLGTNFHFVEL